MDRRSCSEKTAKKNNIVVDDFGEKMLGDALKEAYSICATNSGENEKWTADFKLQNGSVNLINPPSTSSGRVGATLPVSSISSTKEEDASRESHCRLVATLRAANTIVAVLGFVLYSYYVVAAFGAIASVATICTRGWQACAAQTTRYARTGRWWASATAATVRTQLQMAKERSYTIAEVVLEVEAAADDKEQCAFELHSSDEGFVVPDGESEEQYDTDGNEITEIP
jgi:fructose-1,6-bisphosphatase